MSADLTGLDEVALVLSWLRSHPDFLAEFGTADAATGEVEPPYPHVIVKEGSTTRLGDLDVGLVTPEVQIEVYDDPQGSIGKAALRRHTLRVVQIVAEMRTATQSGPVVSNVAHSGTFAFQPLKTGQSRYVVGLWLTLH